MGDLQPLLDLIKQAGGPLALFAVMFYMWRGEREERLKSQERERVVTRELLDSTIKSTNAMRSLRNVFLHGRAPRSDEYEAEDVD